MSEALEELADEPVPPPDEEPEREGRGKPSQATELVRLAESG